MAKGDLTVSVVGLNDLTGKLLSLGVAAKPILRNAVKDGGKVIQRAAQANVKDGPGKKQPPGTLRRSIKVRMRSRGGKISAFVGTGSKNNLYVGKTFYGGFVEYGHKLGSRKLGAARRDVKPHPFMSKAAREKRQQAGDLIISMVKDGLAAAGVT